VPFPPEKPVITLVENPILKNPSSYPFEVQIQAFIDDNAPFIYELQRFFFLLLSFELKIHETQFSFSFFFFAD